MKNFLIYILCVFIVKIESKPILDVVYSQAAVHHVSSDIMSRIIKTITNGKPVVIQGYLAMPDGSQSTLSKQLNDNDVSIQTIFYDDNEIIKTPTKTYNNAYPTQSDDVIIHTITYSDDKGVTKQKPIFTSPDIRKHNTGIQEENVKTSYDVPLHSVEALPATRFNEQTGDVNPEIDVRFGDAPANNQSSKSQLF